MEARHQARVLIDGCNKVQLSLHFSAYVDDSGGNG